jgi:enolase
MNKSSLITDIQARKVFNSRGSPTIEIEVSTKNGFGRALAPGGASKGLHEAVSYPDGNVDQAVKLVGDLIASAASSYGIPLYQKLSEKKSYELPHPLGNILGGGKHAGKNAPDIQEFLALPVEVVSFVKSVEANIRVHIIVRELLKRADVTFTGGKGDEGAWAPNVDNNTALDVVSVACERTTKELGVGIRVGLDVAASSFWDDKRQLYVYSREGVERETGEQIDYILDLIKTYRLVYVEDPVHEEDYEGFVEITKKAKDCLICGDDLFTTNTRRLETGINLKAGNSIIIKPNQIGTLTDTNKTVRLAKSFQYVPVASHRSGETCDPYLAHLAVSYGCPIVKLGVVGGERLSKINELIRIEEDLGDKTRMAELII